MGNCDKAKLGERISRGIIPWGCRMTKLVKDLRRPGATTTAIIIAAFGVVQILRASDVGGETAWKPGHARWYVFVALACVVTVLSLLLALGYRSLLRRYSAKTDFATAARNTLDYVLDNTELTREAVGVKVWRVQGIYGFRHLVEQATALVDDRQETHILWTKGKGAIGQCWRIKMFVHADTETLQTLLAEHTAFCKIPWDDRFRFTWLQFQDTKRFTAVLALPLFTKSYGRYPLRGVLSIDTTAEGGAAQIKGIQDQPKFGPILRACEAVLSGDRD